MSTVVSNARALDAQIDLIGCHWFIVHQLEKSFRKLYFKVFVIMRTALKIDLFLKIYIFHNIIFCENNSREKKSIVRCIDRVGL